MANKPRTSRKVAKKAARALKNPRSTKLLKSLGGSALGNRRK